MQINVTQEDIDNGEADNCTCCPVALALRRDTGKRYEVTSDIHGCYDDVMGRIYNLNYHEDFPKEVEEFIATFDYGLKVKPIIFEFIEPVWI